MRSRLRLQALVLVLAALAAAPVLAQPAEEPAWMRGLDELMSRNVTSVSLKEQNIADTSAAVFVLTREDIRRSGLRTVADLLRLVPGLHVAQIDGNKWAVSSRGMSSRWSNKLQVMIDGRSLYTPYFAGVFWEAVDVPVQAIERIEVIRGPGSSIWGANAVNGVVNIITTGAAVRRETTVAAGAGSLGFGSVLHEGRIGDRIGYRLFADASGYGEMQVSDGSGAQDSWSQRRGGASLRATLNARDTLEASFRGSDSHANAPRLAVTSLAPFEGGFVPLETDAESWAATARWTRQLTGNGHLQIDGFVDQWWRDDDLNHFRRTTDVALQHRPGRLGRHDLVWGGGYRFTHDDTTGNLFISVSPEQYNHRLASVFAQDEIALASGRVYVTLGGKIEHRDFVGLSFQPTVRLHWRPDSRQAVWTAVSRAQRAPDRIERSLRLNMFGFPLEADLHAVVGLQGNPEIAAEWLTAYEGGYRRAIGASATIDIAGYVNRYSGLVTVAPGAPVIEFDRGQPYLFLPVTYGNLVDATTAGLEALVTYEPATRVKLTGSYSLTNIYPEYTAPATAEWFDGLNTPRQQGFVRSSFSLPRAVDLDATVFAVGAIANIGQPAYTRVDSRLAWRPSPAIELFVAAQNLFSGRHMEFGSITSSVAEPSRVSRTAYAGVSWRF